ncbi:galactoside alpha-(1,2)-fucosyltransferase 1 isoform X1 [Ailuropoda melanoleuca]|uniref:galactoside alpha-(1,2)-fucosyltransferase 1 isoform X1 n=1 Tax=Ailuropoda melanoleuca TaxID=9646 RepID=UPI0014940D70|nr:galactoside alpha-(1,2)-fucosyltransferase 1 isoform X1 [Ailuropoda melanoleuca]
MRGVLHSLRRRGWGPRLCNLQAHGAAWRTGSSPPPGGRGGGRRIFLPARAWCPGAVPSGRGVAGLRASRYPGQTVSPGAGEGGEVDGPEHLGPALRLGARSPRPPKDAAAGGQVGRPWRALWLAEADEEGPGRRSPGLGRAGGGGSHPSLGRQDGGGAPPWTYLPSPGGAEAASLGTAPISFLSSPSPWSQSGEEAWRGGLSSLGTWSSGFRGRPDVGCTCGRRAPASPSRLRILSPPGAQPPASLSGIWTIHPDGRFGNQMGQYATLLALAQLNGRQAFILPAMHATLAPMFRITLPVLAPEVDGRMPWRELQLHDWMSEDYAHLEDAFLKLTGFPCSWTFFHHLRAQIRREFTLHEHLQQEAQGLLSQLRLGHTGDHPRTFVGVHVRRGDYLQVMPHRWKGVVGDRAYLQQAMDWFRARHEAPVFVVVSNGMAWCRENIDASRGDVIFAGDGQEGSPGKDFALLMQCNHTIMTIGTFGFWAAYLAGGDTVYLANFTLPDSNFLKIFKPEAAFLPKWVGINADLSALQ